MVTPVRIIVMIYLITVSCACASGNADTHPYRVGVLENDAIDESSGLAASRIHPDILWTLNDSGSKPVLFAVSTTGADSGQITIMDADNRDWEDLAAFKYRQKSYLAIGDVGDNAGRRDFCTIYVIEEPKAIGKQIRDRTKVKSAWRIDFRYEDGPRDCESIAVDTAGQRILLLSKRTMPPVLYGLQEAICRKTKKVVLNVDSQLVARQLRGEYKVKDQNILKFFDLALHLFRGFDEVEIREIPREENKDADALVNKAINLKALL